MYNSQVWNPEEELPPLLGPMERFQVISTACIPYLWEDDQNALKMKSGLKKGNTSC